MSFLKKFLFLFFSFLIFGCKNSKNTEDELRISINMNPPTLDATKSRDIASSFIISLLFCGLTEHKPDGSFGMALAERYDLSEDKKTYTFYLKENIKWSDGKEITANDFEKSWKKVIDPNHPSSCSNLFYPIINAEKAAKGKISVDKVGIKAIDKKTFVVKLNSPTPYFFSLTSFNVFFPIPIHIAEKNPNWANNFSKIFLSSGPFMLKKFDYNNEIILEKNPLYWNAKNVKLKRMHISIIKNDNTALQMFENGDLDWLGTYTSPLPIDSIPTILKKKEHKTTPVGGSTFCAFNTKRFPFNNKNMRKAFGYAINRKKIVKNITQANEIIATRCIPPVLMNNKNFELYKDNNVEKAKELFKQALKELGVKRENLAITFSHGANITNKKQAETIQETWQKTFNIKVKLESLEEKTRIDKLHNKNFQVALNFWLAQYDDAMSIFERFKHNTNTKNYPSWENKEYNKLLDLAAIENNAEKRIKILEKAEKIFIEEMPLAPIYHHNYITLTKPYVKGIYIGKIGSTHFERAYIEKKH